MYPMLLKRKVGSLLKVYSAERSHARQSMCMLLVEVLTSIANEIQSTQRVKRADAIHTSQDDLSTWGRVQESDEERVMDIHDDEVTYTDHFLEKEPLYPFSLRFPYCEPETQAEVMSNEIMRLTSSYRMGFKRAFTIILDDKPLLSNVAVVDVMNAFAFFVNALGLPESTLPQHFAGYSFSADPIVPFALAQLMVCIEHPTRKTEP